MKLVVGVLVDLTVCHSVYKVCGLGSCLRRCIRLPVLASCQLQDALFTTGSSHRVVIDGFGQGSRSMTAAVTN